MTWEPGGPRYEPVFGVSDRIRKAIAVKGLTLMEMSVLLEVSNVTMSKWLARPETLNLGTLRRIAEITGVLPSWLISGMDDEVDLHEGGQTRKAV